MKKRILELTNIPVCRQVLRGWMQKGGDHTNLTRLSSMNVALENELIVTDVGSDGGGAMADEDIARLNDMYTLNVLNEKMGYAIPLQFRGTQTILEIKTHVYTITNIAVRHQEWTGWPAEATNDTMLGMLGIPLVHDLVLKSTEPEPTNANEATATGSAPETAEPEVIDIDSDSTAEEFEDASDFNGDDYLFSSPPQPNRVKFLSESSSSRFRRHFIC